MGTRPEGRPSAEGRPYSGYQQSRDVEHDEGWNRPSPPSPRSARPTASQSLNDERGPSSPSFSADGRDRQVADPHTSSEDRGRSRHRSARKGSGQLKICKKCQEPLTGQFVRALGGTFHLDCFKCRDCGQVVASKFFPAEEEDGSGQYPLCETDYFRRLDLLCHECGGALRGSYITALDRKYHIDHFTCSMCPTVFGAQDSYYEHDGRVYCHFHYSTQYAQRCNGCHTAILKQFVEIFRNGQNQHWHPECYMIHKFWNVRLAPAESSMVHRHVGEDADDAGREAIRLEEEVMEVKVYRIWSVLSTFEESSAACISDMLLHVSNGAYVDGVLVAKKFIWHVEVLFKSADILDATMIRQSMKGLSYSREAKLLCKKIVAFFSLLSNTQDTGVKKLGVTQELLSLVTGLAHYLKLLIRICLQGALKVEREVQSTEGLNQFLDGLNDFDALGQDQPLDATTGVTGLAAIDSDQCSSCHKAIENECTNFGERRWHLACIHCFACGRDISHNMADVRWSERERQMHCNRCEGRSPADSVGGFTRITRLEQYVYLLRVALARLLSMLRNSGALAHTTDEPNLNGYNSQEGYHLPDRIEPSMLRSDTRSKSFGEAVDEYPRESSYENTLNDVRRLRSTRMDKHLSSTLKKARTSRVLDGPEGHRPGSANADESNKRMSIVEDYQAVDESKNQLYFGHENALTLDDIPKIVAAEQAKDQRPNAYRHARHDLFNRNSVNEPKLKSAGHLRTVSGNSDLENAATNDENLRSHGGKKFFSELTALEYFTVRNLAVIAMQPLLEGLFTLEELLQLVEPRKQTFWDKFGKAFKGPPKGGKKKGVFGVPLDVIIERDGADSTDGIGPGALRIPALIEDAISCMRKMDLSVEGVFRKNGNIKRLNDTAVTINKEGCDKIDLSKENVVQVAALLKKYLRDLPDPLLTFKLHRLYITSQKVTDPEKRRRILHLTACLLPKSHRDCIEILFTFLSWVASFHQVDEDSGSKMDTHNLATVIAPNILYTNAKNSGMDDSFLAIEAVNTLIEYNARMCEVPEDFQSILGDPSFFNNSGDITTKEILKRYGDIAAIGGPKKINEASETILPLGRSKAGSGRALAPAITRVDTDPSQQHAWQEETSVRHVQDPQIPYGSPSQNTLPQQWASDGELGSPHIRRTGTPDSARETPSRRDWRHSGWSRAPPQNGNGSMGVMGATN